MSAAHSHNSPRGAGHDLYPSRASDRGSSFDPRGARVCISRIVNTLSFASISKRLLHPSESGGMMSSISDVIVLHQETDGEDSARTCDQIEDAGGMGRAS